MSFQIQVNDNTIISLAIVLDSFFLLIREYKFTILKLDFKETNIFVLNNGS